MGDDEAQAATAVETGVDPQTPLQGDEGEAMDIHRPKAAHSWREFLIEIGTIICGILIALSLEQVVEAIHRDAEVREARAALHVEIKANVATAMFAREEVNCIRPQMDAFANWARGGPKPPPTRTGLPMFSFSAWESLKATAVPHMPLKERVSLGDFYETLRNSESGIEQRRTAMTMLFGAHERTVLRAEDAGRVLDAVGMERRIGGFQRTQSRWILAGAKTLGIDPGPLTPESRDFLAWECGRGGHDPYAEKD